VVMDEIEIPMCLCKGGNLNRNTFTCPWGKTWVCPCKNVEKLVYLYPIRTRNIMCGHKKLSGYHIYSYRT
jgi:hypothetical protein